MTCATCASDLPDAMSFCPSCGSPGSSATSPDTRVIPTSEVADAAAPRRRSSVGPSSTTLLTPAPAPATGARGTTRREGPSVGERVAPAAREARQQARQWADRFGTLPFDLRVALVGTFVTVLSFFVFDYAAGLDKPVGVSGRLWLLPISAVGATALLYGSLRRSGPAVESTEVPRRTDGLLAAVAIAAAGAAEAGLFSLLAGDVVGPRAGFYGMLLGLVVILGACVRAARRTLR